MTAVKGPIRTSLLDSLLDHAEANTWVEPRLPLTPTLQKNFPPAVLNAANSSPVPVKKVRSTEVAG